LQKLYLFTHRPTLTIARLTVQEVVCGCLLL